MITKETNLMDVLSEQTMPWFNDEYRVGLQTIFDSEAEKYKSRGAYIDDGFIKWVMCYAFSYGRITGKKEERAKHKDKIHGAKTNRL